MTGSDVFRGVLRLPGQVWFGSGTRSLIPGVVADHGTRACVVADPFLARTPDFTDLVDGLRGRGVVVQVCADIAPELPVASLDAMGSTAATFGPDVVIGYGGGSALDAAKLVALLLTHGGPLSRWYGENAVPGPVLPIIAVPTTAGTGSEVTPVAVVADPTREMKVGISSPHIIPRYAVVDPELTIGAPAAVTAYSGIDALVHAVESYTARRLPFDPAGAQPVFTGRNALSDPMSLDAVRHIGSALETAVRNPGDLDARAAMAYGSLAAGIAFGATGTHLAHALQYPIGAMTHTPHGLGTGMMLPYVLTACAPAIGDRLAAIGDALGLEQGPDLPERAIDRISQIGVNIGLPPSLSELDIERSDLPRVAELAMQSTRLVNIAPAPVTVELLREILESAFAGSLHAVSH